jgi:hypothetical protein
MRELPSDVDADAVIEVGRYLDNHAKTTAVSVSEARRVNGSRISDCGLEELILESAATRHLAILMDNR